jgi:Domain of unknown function (DUF6894)
MPRFYFHFRSQQGLSPDLDGVEFPGLNEAYIDAFRAATDLWRELLVERVDPRDYSFEIANADGQLLLVLPFAEVLNGTWRPKPARIFELIERAQQAASRSVDLTDQIWSQVLMAKRNLAQSLEVLRRSRDGGAASPGASKSG